MELLTDIGGFRKQTVCKAAHKSDENFTIDLNILPSKDVILNHIQEESNLISDKIKAYISAHYNRAENVGKALSFDIKGSVAGHHIYGKHYKYVYKELKKWGKLYQYTIKVGKAEKSKQIIIVVPPHYIKPYYKMSKDTSEFLMMAAAFGFNLTWMMVLIFGIVWCNTVGQ